MFISFNFYCNGQLFGYRDRDTTLLTVCSPFNANEWINYVHKNQFNPINFIWISIKDTEQNDSISQIDWARFINVKSILFDSGSDLDEKEIIKYNFPKSIYNIKGVKELRYCDLYMDEIPEEIGNLDSLTYLKIQNIKNLKSFTQSICKLKKLETIEFDFTNITNIPLCIKECKSLKTIRYQNGYENQKLDTVFYVFSTIPNLNYLDVWNHSNYYPFNKYKFEKVEYLYITQSKINIKKAFSKPENLPNLKFVDFSGCKFDKMPVELGNFKKIDTLVLIDAIVKRITNDVVKLNNIKVLYINTLKDKDLKKLKMLLPNCEIISKRPEGYIVW